MGGKTEGGTAGSEERCGGTAKSSFTAARAIFRFTWPVRGTVLRYQLNSALSASAARFASR